jgi:hypothetical protein
MAARDRDANPKVTGEGRRRAAFEQDRPYYDSF